METSNQDQIDLAIRLALAASTLMNAVDASSPRDGCIFLVNVARAMAERAEAILRDSGGLPVPVELE